MTAVHLLQAFPDVAEQYRRRFRHVLVDEYQDTNHAQYVLVRELVGTRQRRTVEGDLVGPASSTPELAPAELCVVGDADQSIYAFRGATIRNILQFETDYSDARVILLEQNYRSTQTILSAANAVISRNPDRKPKRLWTDSGDGPKVVGYVADDEHMEAQFVAEEIDRLGDEALAKSGDVAVFYRTNAVGCWKRCSSGSGCPTGSSVGSGSTSGGRSGTRSPTCAPWRTRTTRCRCAASSTFLAGPSATVPRASSRRSPSGRGSRSGRRCAGQQMRRGSQRGRFGRSSRSWHYRRTPCAGRRRSEADGDPRGGAGAHRLSGGAGSVE